MTHPLPLLVLYAILLVAATTGATAQQRLSDPQLKCLSVPMYYPGAGIRFNRQIADDTAYLNPAMIRMEFIGEPGPTRPINYAAYDYVVREAGRRGMRILGLIDYASVPGSDATWETPGFRQAFLDRVTEIVTHFHDSEFPIKDWKIWNEPDLDLRTIGGPMYRLEPETFAIILRDSYEIIRAIDPEATVVLGGISPKGMYYGTNYLDDVYNTQTMQDYFSEHGVYPFDVVGAHPYPEIFVAPNPGLANALNTHVKAVMNAHGDRHKKVWLTEMGWSSFYVSESAQATYLRDSFLLVESLRDPAFPADPPYVERYFWFQYEDFSNVDRWGLWTEGLGRKKPTYEAFLNLTEPGPEPEPVIIEPGQNPPVWFGTSDADLPVRVSNSDLLHGMVPIVTRGGFHSASIGPVASLTNGLFDANPLTLVLRDYPYPAPALSLRFDFDRPVDIRELRLFAGHMGDSGNRAFQSHDVWINGLLAKAELNTGNYGQSSPSSSASAVSVVRWLPADGEDFVARRVFTLEIDMYAVTSLPGISFLDRWSQLNDPDQDRDGSDAAFVSPVMKEIDAIGRLSPLDPDGWLVW